MHGIADFVNSIGIGKSLDLALPSINNLLTFCFLSFYFWTNLNPLPYNTQEVTIYLGVASSKTVVQISHHNILFPRVFFSLSRVVINWRKGLEGFERGLCIRFQEGGKELKRVIWLSSSHTTSTLDEPPTKLGTLISLSSISCSLLLLQLPMLFFDKK